MQPAKQNNHRTTEIAALLVIIGYLFTRWTFRFFIPDLFTRHEAWFWTLDVATSVLVPAALLLGLKRVAGLRWSDLGLAHPTARMSRAEFIFVCAAIGLFAWVVERFMFVVASSLWPRAEVWFSFGQVVPHDPPLRLLAVGYMAIQAGLVEELIFRAVPAVALRHFTWQRGHYLAYLLAATIPFAMLHAGHGPIGIFTTAGVGLLLAVVYASLRNIWVVVVAHAIVDVVSFW